MLSILSYIVVVLTLVVGLSVFTSNRHMKERVSALSLGLAYFGAGLWALFVQLFRNSVDPQNAHIFHQLFTIVALLIPVGCIFFAFSIYRRKASSVIICILATLIATIVGYLIISNPNMFYTDIVMVEGSNYAILTSNLLAMSYCGIFGVYLSVAVLMVFAKMFKTKKASLRRGLLFIGCGLSISAGISLVFNVIMPFLGQHDLFWIGPLSIAVAMLFTYFATLKYRVFVNGNRMLQYSTYLVVVAMAALVYICLFYLVFMLVFRGASPSNEIIIFQFVMVVIVVLLLPSINHFIEYIKKLITDNGTIEMEKKDDAK